MVLWGREKRNEIIIYVTVLNTHNMMETIVKIKRKYCELQQKIKRMCDMENVNVVPLIISTTGVIQKYLHEKIK